jgi:hypothetical protein
LHCSLELSLDEVAEQQQESIAVALQQTEKVISMVRLMREYLDAEHPGPGAFSVALAPVLQNVVEELSSIAVVRDVQLSLVGACSATLPVPEARLRLALQYLIATVIEAQPAGGRVLLALSQNAAGAVLRVIAKLGFRGVKATGLRAERDALPVTSAATATLLRVKMAIASRVFESAGGSLAFTEGASGGFILRVPCWTASGA